MIQTHEQFEATLEAAMRLMNEAPMEGTPNHRRLLTLMEDIAAYRPVVRVDAPREDSASERLARRLDAFERRLAPQLTPHWRAMIGGDFHAPREA